MGVKEMRLVAEMDQAAWDHYREGRADLANELWHWCSRFGDQLEREDD